MKKSKKAIVCIGVALVAVLLLTILSNKFYRTTFESLNETDQRMLRELSTIYTNFEKSSDKLWDKDYRFDKEPLVLIGTNKDRGFWRREAYVVNVPQMESNLFTAEIKTPDSLRLPKVYRLSRFDVRALSAWFPANFSTLTINDTEVMYYKYHPKMLNDPDLYFDFASFLLHEAFHTYKQKEWTYDLNGSDHIVDYLANKENYALMGVEFSLLDQAMTSNSPETIQQLLYDWTLVRNYRYQKWPQLIAETKTEAIEGSARYIEYRYSQLTGGNLTVLALKEKPYHITFMQAFNYIANGEAYSPSFLQRDIRYETGSALELLMDKANIAWKEAIEDRSTQRGKTQYETLKAYFKLDGAAVDELQLNPIKAKYDYENLLRQGQKLVSIGG
ncbi:hypothetical protein [Paenibacillus sp. 481]|uniref:hypothetical protein n=1 Tax=Paenibacillus sp. 481 TaxID=2835869 RepID=UPI001E375912|nr:hypothetical protein [Paenibacillus sp. 481]UHA74994.1 hypothetical protein KIK04_08185 [Paenibacillus sp. 481]